MLTILVVEQSRNSVACPPGLGQSRRLLSASSTVEAKSLLEDHPVDLILLDWPGCSPEMEGFLRTLEKRELWSIIPVISLLREDCLQNRLSALEAGARDTFHPKMDSREVELRLSALLRQKSRSDRLRRDREHLAHLALTDPLTGLHNRPYFEASLEIETTRSHGSGAPCSLMLVDLDHFRVINETFGHAAGDFLLQAIARTLRENLRRTDILCRYGGEEFAVILPETSPPAAFAMAERLRKKIAQVTLSDMPREFTLSASIGIAFSESEEIHPRQLVERAENALETGKRNGRNRTEVFQSLSGRRMDHQALWATVGTA